MMAFGKRQRPSIPRFWQNQTQMNQRLVDQVRELQKGHTNNVFEVTLAVAPATTTKLAHPDISVNAAVQFAAKTANAAAEVGAGTIYATVLAGEVTFHHASSALADRTFHVTING